MSSYYGREPWNDEGSNLMFEMLSRLPKFGGAIGEDPVRHIRTFHSICSHMKPKDESLEGFKLKCFKFSLINSAIAWYYSCAAYEGDYLDLRAKFLEEFSPPSLRLKTRKEIINLEQSRDETLDEYYSYFDSIVTSCPHHGFTDLFLLQRFLGGMMPLEWKRLNDAAGCSVMKLTMSEIWDLIDDLAESTKRGQWHQTDDKAPTVEADPVQIEEEPTIEPTEPAEDEDPWLTEEELNSDYPRHLEEDGPLATEEEPAEPLKPVLIAELPEEVPVLTDGLVEKGPDLVVEVPQLNPLVFMQIMATKDHAVNDDAVQGKLEAVQGQGRPTMELTLVMSQEKPPENPLVPKRPIISATKKRLSMGTSLRSPMFDGTMLNFQKCKGANHSNMKKRPRHGPKEWKPGWRNTRPRLNGPAAMVKGASPSRKHVKENLPDEWRTKPSTSLHEFFGQSKRAAEKKFDLTHPWDPNL